jgi:hypothetical protein
MRINARWALAIMNTHRFYIILTVVCLITSNCTTSSDVKNESNLNAPASVSKPSPPPSPSPISMTASQKDGINDVADGNGRKPPAKLNGVDLVGVQLEMTDTDLKVTFEANDPIPTSIPAGQSVLWQVEAWSSDKTQGYYLGAKLVESKWYVFIFNLKTATNEYVQNPSVSEKKLVVSFSLSQLPNLAPSFTWSATAEYDGKWRDKLPNEGKVSFPAS